MNLQGQQELLNLPEGSWVGGSRCFHCQKSLSPSIGPVSKALFMDGFPLCAIIFQGRAMKLIEPCEVSELT